MVAEDEHDGQSLRSTADRFGGERTSYCSDLLNTDSFFSWTPSPLTEPTYSTGHNITSFIRELNSPLLEMGYTHLHGTQCIWNDAHTRTKILAGRLTQHQPSSIVSLKNSQCVLTNFAVGGTARHSREIKTRG